MKRKTVIVTPVDELKAETKTSADGRCGSFPIHAVPIVRQTCDVCGEVGPIGELDISDPVLKTELAKWCASCIKCKGLVDLKRMSLGGQFVGEYNLARVLRSTARGLRKDLTDIYTEIVEISRGPK